MSSGFSDLRREYLHAGLDEADMAADPFTQFNIWFNKAVESGIDLPNAMALATATKDGRPSVRFVLLKDVSEEGFVFYSHTVSRKGRDMEENPNVSLVFYWAPMDRQIRIEGKIETVSAQEAGEYFNSRPRASRASAWVAPQSSVVESREFLEQHYQKIDEEYSRKDIPCPDTWAGYRVIPDAVEFWQGRENRLHDRILYHRSDTGSWSLCRLAP